MENRPWQRHYDYNVPTTIRYPRLAAHELLDIPANTFPIFTYMEPLWP